MTTAEHGTGVKFKLRISQSAVDGVAGGEIELGTEPVWLGRDASCELVVPDTSMSRRHASLQVAEGGRVEVQDNGSSNGVFVDGQRVKKTFLTPGEKFRLGSTIFELIGETPPPPEMKTSTFQTEFLDRTMVVSGFDEIAKQLDQANEAAQAKQEKLEDEGESLGEGDAGVYLPFLISDSSAVWTLESGTVEIFMVGLEKGEPVGARNHFLTIGAGEVFFGLENEMLGFDTGFIAVPKPGSKIRRIEVERLQFFAGQPEHRKRISEMVTEWVSKVSKKLVQDVANAPRPEISLRAGESAVLGEEQVTMSGNEVLWFEVPRGRMLLDGMGSLSYETEGVLFPIAPGSWIELLSSETEVELEPLRTSDAIDDSRMWAGLEAFHRIFMECEFTNKQLGDVDEFNRLQQKAERADEAKEAAVGAIESVLAGAANWHQPKFAADAGDVFDCCAIVADAMGLTVKRPMGDLSELDFEETVTVISGASRFRIRRVALIDNWWKLEQGPMLAQHEDTGNPVALVQEAPGKYRMIDPIANENRALTEADAKALNPFAYSFYRRFPDGVMSARDLFRFSTWNLKREFREVLIMGIVTGLLGTAVPSITGMVFDAAIPQAERLLLWQLGMGLLGIAIATALFKVTQNVATLRIQSKMDYSVQAATWDRLLDLPVTFFKDYSAGDLADRAAAVDKMRAIIAGAGIGAILGSFASMFNAIQMALYSAKLAAVAIALTLLYVSLTFACNVIKLQVQRKEMHRQGQIMGLVLQLIAGVPKLRVSGTEAHAFRTWATEFAEMRKNSFLVGRIGNFMPVLNAGYPVMCSMVIFFSMAKFKEQALTSGAPFTMTTGDFLAFNAAFGIFLGAMQALGDVSVSMLGIVPLFERLKPILEEEPEVDETKVAPARLDGKIELSRIAFRYTSDGPLVLKDISLTIEPGQFVAFVGGSGSGKSTLMKVMLGFLHPEAGAVYYDGMDMSTLDVRLVRQQLGVVLQESRLLPADIFRNIVGSSSKTVADAWEAARKAGLDTDIKRLPMGMHTYVTEGGGGFSGGQKQRLMIARSLINNPKVMYLDEATSALDNRTQAIVTESMDRLQSTRIVIAHRLSTIANADIICYLDQGELIEKGTYQELIELDGKFAELARRQLA